MVGIPRGLLVYDYAPLLMVSSTPLTPGLSFPTRLTTKSWSRPLSSYTDSCFPLKLLHGHAAMLKDVDYILYPCAIRLGRKDGDASQKYSCPWFRLRRS